jgi:hypothetical protein
VTNDLLLHALNGPAAPVEAPALAYRMLQECQTWSAD